MTTYTSYTYKARSEFTGTRDIVQLAAAMITLSLQDDQDFECHLMEVKEGTTFGDCATGVFYSDLPYKEFYDKMVEASDKYDDIFDMDPHRVFQTVKPINEFDGDFNDFD